MELDLKKTTIRTFLKKKADGEKIAMLTAYDFPIANLLDAAGIDGILIGDSLGQVVQGRPDTLAVTVDDIIYHAKAVGRGAEQCLIVGDMPFMSYQASEEDGLRNAGRIMKEGGCHAVKLEGAGRFCSLIKKLVESGIPVMGHLGLTPQSINVFGGYKVQGKLAGEAKRLLDDAKSLEAAGCFSIVLECIPREIAAEITRELSIPTIGIGAGPGCDGQILVINDLVTLYPGFCPKFVRRYADVGGIIQDAVSKYIDDVRAGGFPSDAESFNMKPEELEKALEFLGGGRKPAVEKK
jgi:3-methyl-2-oxobutanoate hydroxymethyltransferase